MSRNGRPLELPGLYWDEERNRYFPTSSKPNGRPAKRKVEETDSLEPSVPNANANLRKGRHITTGAAYVRNTRTGVYNAPSRAQLIQSVQSNYTSWTFHINNLVVK